MGIKFDLDQIISQVGRDKGIDKEVLVEALESAVLSAAKKHYGHRRNIEASFNAELGEIEVLEFRTVVEEVTDSETQMTLEEARAEFAGDCEIGEELGRKLEAGELGRIAAQTAKQVIFQKLRDAEREIIFKEFKGRKGEIVNGIVQRFEHGGIIVNLGRTDAVLPDREQISKERYRQNDRLRAMILDIDSSGRGPQIVLSRSHPDFMRKLFELEVPEVSEGLVEIKGIAREPGERAKMAVYSSDSGVDPLGACVGVKGARVQAVSSELKGERIEIVIWTPDAPSFVARALSPAEVTRVIVDEDEHSMEVVVADEQLSLAIGKRGQNVKLASKLSGWKIDVRSESVAEEESKRARAVLESIPAISFGEPELLYQEGYRTIREVANANFEDIAAMEGIGAERATVIVSGARSLIESNPNALSFSSHGGPGGGRNSIRELILPSELKTTLLNSGYDTVQSLETVTLEELEEKSGIERSDAEQALRAARLFLAAVFATTEQAKAS